MQKIYTHFKRAPATHKLGVLYVVDAVTRQWLEKSGSSGQDVAASNPQDGTFAAGVHKITQLLPGMMNDLVANAPYDQKVSSKYPRSFLALVTGPSASALVKSFRGKWI